MAAEAEFGSLHTGAELALAELIERCPEAGTDEEALALLNAVHERGFAFNSERWRALVVLARISARAGDSEAATAAARAALDLFAGNEPQLPRHPDVGVIRADDATLEEMCELAGGSGA